MELTYAGVAWINCEHAAKQDVEGSDLHQIIDGDQRVFKACIRIWPFNSFCIR